MAELKACYRVDKTAAILGFLRSSDKRHTVFAPKHAAQISHLFQLNGIDCEGVYVTLSEIPPETVFFGFEALLEAPQGKSLCGTVFLDEDDLRILAHKAFRGGLSETVAAPVFRTKGEGGALPESAETIRAFLKTALFPVDLEDSRETLQGMKSRFSALPFYGALRGVPKDRIMESVFELKNRGEMEFHPNRNGVNLFIAGMKNEAG